MDILELLKLLNGHLNAITINLVSDKDWMDKVSLLAPMLIGLAALYVSWDSNRSSTKSQRENSLIQAKMEIATKLKYEWLNSIRELSSQYAASVALTMECCFRMSNIINQIKHYRIIGCDNEDDIKELNESRIEMYNEIEEGRRKVSIAAHMLETYLDVNAHLVIFKCMKDISLIINKENASHKNYDVEQLLIMFKAEMYNIISSEWKVIVELPPE
ncbi:hypothetical protein ACNGYR_002124 [Serratia marcescens]